VLNVAKACDPILVEVANDVHYTSPARRAGATQRSVNPSEDE